MKLLLAAAGMALAIGLSGCTTLQQVVDAYGTVTDASVPAKTVIVAANAFDAVEATAKNILVACTPVTRPAACNDTSLRSLVKAVQAGRKARDGLEGFLASHPGQLGSKGLYDALSASIATISAVVTTYNGAN